MHSSMTPTDSASSAAPGDGKVLSRLRIRLVQPLAHHIESAWLHLMSIETEIINYEGHLWAPLPR
jgi:hypothetical protein